MSDDLLDAIALLRRKRADHLAQVEKIDAALVALAEVIDEPEQRQTGKASTNGLAARVVEKIEAQGQTTRQKIVSLAEEEDRNWSVGQMISEYNRRGAPFTGANPDSAVRAAIVTATQKDELYRTAHGRYRATKFRPSEPDSGMDFDNPDGHQVSEIDEVSTS